LYDLCAAVEAINARGLARAGAALLGAAPEAVCAALPAQLPWLPAPCWRALAPLSVAPPHDADTVLLARLLAGAATDPGAALVAIAAVTDAAGADGAWQPLPAEGIVDELWRRALLTALRDFWLEVAHGYGAAGDALARADAPAAVAAVRQVGRAVDGAAERVAVLAARVGDAARAPGAAAAAWQTGPPPLVVEPDRAKLVLPREVDPPPPPRRRPLRPLPRPLPPPPPRVQERGFREHSLLPLAFLVVAVAAAAAVLYVVAYGVPPLP
jgi:hypothetical protein